MTPLWIASDHAGFELKTTLLATLENAFSSRTWIDLGCQSVDSVDYPDYAKKLCQEIIQATSESGGKLDTQACGILICGSGIGMSIAANRFEKIRAALVNSPEQARLSREHNAANVLCLGARFLSLDEAQEIIRVFVNTPFSGGERHLRRIGTLSQSTFCS
jgi:ribose 5-phosphate isomerase B